jgi:hypothetical protein
MFNINNYKHILTMKRLALFFVVVVLTMTQILAQESTFKKGDKVLNLSVGFGSGLYTGGGYTTSVPPLAASFEVGVKDFDWKGSIGVGGIFAYGAHKWEYAGWGWKYTNIIIGARGALHYPLAKKLDTYTGLVIGYNIVSSTEFGVNPIYDYSAKSSGVAYSWFVGARYYFTDRFAVLGELGVGISYLNLGIALKF